VLACVLETFTGEKLREFNLTELKASAEKLSSRKIKDLPNYSEGIFELNEV
jgi:hypothetical protein